MVINTNIEAQATANNLKASQLQLAKSLARLSSGSKIIVPSDDAAGLAVSSRLNSQIKRLDSALNNVVNAVSFTQTQDGFMKTIDKAFRRMGELAMLAQDTTKSDEDRALYNQEFAQLKDYVSETTKQDFNGVSLFAGKTLDVTVDADGTTFTMIGINLGDPTYTSSTNTGTDAWKLTSNAYMLSKDGYKVGANTYKTSVDLWRGLDGTWATTNNGGAKIAAGTYTTEDITNTDTAAKTIAKDNFISQGTLNAGFNTNFPNNQLEKSGGHGMSTGDSLTFSTNAPAGTTVGTTYYVNKTSTTGLTLHATLSDANANANVIDLTRSGVSAAKTGVVSTTGGTAKFTKASHNLAVGDQVTITKNAPGGFNAGTTYHVKTVSGSDFTLAATNGGAAIAPTTAVVNMEYTTDTIAGNSNGAAAPNDSGIVTVATGHYLNNGDEVMLNDAHGGKAAGTAFFINKVDVTNFKIYDTAANARLGGTTGLQTFTASGAVRFSLTDSETNVATLNQSNQLKAGMFITANPILIGEDKDAVLAKTGDVVSINKSVQDINAFANELGANYDDVNLKSVEAAQTALILVKSAITQVATDRAKLGAVQSRLNFTSEQLTVTKENLSAAISRISDVDVAEEATNYARYQILVASGTEMLKQANQLPQSALQLLR